MRRSTAALVPTVVAAVMGVGPAAVGAQAAEPSSSVWARTVHATNLHRSPDGLPIRRLPPPGQFVRRIDNPYLPWAVGSRWVYEGTGSERGERNVVRVLKRHTRIEGIRATVVLDIVRDDGKLIEHTLDWYAQDRDGNVWYLGERTKAYDDGEVSTEGSWRAGVHHARAGIAMPAHPHVGQAYRQEYRRGVAEDQGLVLDASTRASAPSGDYSHVVLTEDTTRIEPRVVELKFYAPGVGGVTELDVSPDRGSSSLVRYQPAH